MKTAIQIVSKGYFHLIQEFHIEKDTPLGVGSFGTVRLGIHIKTSKTYAIKIIDISEGMSDNELKVLERQILLHSSLDHPHLIKLWDTICQGNKIYMILEYASSGSLFHYQNRYTKFSEAEGYKYFYQTMEGLKYLHSQNIMHRDIKPQNLLLDNDRNIKICDFGWATENIHQKRSTFCGTYQYMAPQMAYEKQYDYRIDIWALGILIFELTHGHAPFKAKSLEDIKHKLMKGVYEISNTCSKQLKHLIMSILQFDPEDRPTIQQVCNHQWTQKIPQTILRQILSEQENIKKQKLEKQQKSITGSNKKINRQLSSEEVSIPVPITKTNNYVTIINNNVPNQSKHKKYESTDLQNYSTAAKGHNHTASIGVASNIIRNANANGVDTSGKLNFNRNIKKNNEEAKKMLKKKCKTQGQEYIEKDALYQGFQIERGKFNDDKFNNLLQAQNINLFSINSGTNIRKKNSGSNISTQMVNQICHPFSTNKENTPQYNFGNYNMNKVQTLTTQSFRNSNGFDQFSYGAVNSNMPLSHDKSYLANQSGNTNNNSANANISSSKTRKLEHKISELTNKYVTDKFKMKSKNMKHNA